MSNQITKASASQSSYRSTSPLSWSKRRPSSPSWKIMTAKSDSYNSLPNYHGPKDGDGFINDHSILTYSHIPQPSRIVVIRTKPQQYHSIRIDRPRHRSVHILPENYQYCSLGEKFRLGPIGGSGPEVFGLCSASVHFGLCTDFDVFVEQDKNFDPSSRFYYTIKTPSLRKSSPSGISTAINKKNSGGGDSDGSIFQKQHLSVPPTTPISFTDQQSLLEKIESFGDDIGRALELLATSPTTTKTLSGSNCYAPVEDEPTTHLEDLIRNFVREDRLRLQQGGLSTPSTPTSHESSPLSPTISGTDGVNAAAGRRILLKKSQADLVFQQSKEKSLSPQVNGNDSSSTITPFRRDGVVQQRLIRFTNHNQGGVSGGGSSSRPSSPVCLVTSTRPLSPICGDHRSSSPTPHHTTSSTTNGGLEHRTVFGISPKSSSLSRYKNLIESRSETSSPIQQNFATGIDLINLESNSLENNNNRSSTPTNYDYSNRSKTLPNIHTFHYGSSYGNKHRDNSNQTIMASSPRQHQRQPAFPIDDFNNNKNNNNNSLIPTLTNNQPNHHNHLQQQPNISGNIRTILDSSHDSTNTNNNNKIKSTTTLNQQKNIKNTGEQQHHNLRNKNGEANVIDSSGKCTNFGDLSSSYSSSAPSSPILTASTSSAFQRVVGSSSSFPSLSSSSVSSTPLSSARLQQSSGNVQSSSTPQSSFGSKFQPSTTIESSTLDSSSDPLLEFVARTNQQQQKQKQLQQQNNHKLNPSPNTSSYHSQSSDYFDHRSNKDGIIGSSSSNIQPSSKDILNNSNTIDTFIKENENFFQSGHKLTRSFGVIESHYSHNQLVDNYSIDAHLRNSPIDLVDLSEEMKYQQQHYQQQQGSRSPQSQPKTTLTEDEKALLQDSLKVNGLYGGGGPKVESGKESDTTDSLDTNKQTSQQQPQKRRIIFVSKPAPKPEPKPEPKYVNGKVVFGQTHVKHNTLQKGSVAERVMLFEKCPEKTSVTKSKLNELQRNRITNVNKIGHWMKLTETQAVQNKINKSPETTSNQSNVPLLTLADSVGASKTLTSEAKTASTASESPSIIKKDELEPKPGSPSPSISSISTFRRLSRSNSLSTGTLPGQLPRFYYPLGRPYSSQEVENQMKRIIAVFERFPSRTVTMKEFGGVLKLCGIPMYWKEPLFRYILAEVKNNPILTNGNNLNNSNPTIITTTRRSSLDYGAKNGFSSTPTINGNNGAKKDSISCDEFSAHWRKLISTCYDDASRFLRIMTQGKRDYIIPEDFEPLIQDVIDTHPGLLFLKEAEEFHSRYVHTVIARIYYCVDKKWSGTIRLPELRKSNLLRVIHLLEEEDDINQITEYFSYEHFYVIYCKFWELDQDHDLFISKFDLARHDDSAISPRMIDRIFSGAVTRTSRTRSNQMSYTEFVWFLLADEDKRHPRAIEYWFRCMDLDGDGCLSFYELEYFYNEQVRRMESAGIEALPFTDCLCQMIDLVSPKDPSKITLADLKKCRLTPIFFDTFFNLQKYLDHEQRDPFASQRDEDGNSMSDWDRYAAEEYEYLVLEESKEANYLSTMTASSIHKKLDTINSYYPNGEKLVDCSDGQRNNNFIDEGENYGDDEDEDEEEELGNTEDEMESSEDEYDCEESEQPGRIKRREDGRVYLVIEPNRKPHEKMVDSESIIKRKSRNIEKCLDEIDSMKSKMMVDANNNEKSTNCSNNNDFDDIGREFYEYIKTEFESPPTKHFETIKLVKLNPVNNDDSGSIGQNGDVTTNNANPFDGDEFY